MARRKGNWLGECFSTKELYGRHTGHTTVIHSYIQDCVTNDDAIKSEEREKYH